MIHDYNKPNRYRVEKRREVVDNILMIIALSLAVFVEPITEAIITLFGW